MALSKEERIAAKRIKETTDVSLLKYELRNALSSIDRWKDSTDEFGIRAYKTAQTNARVYKEAIRLMEWETNAKDKN